MSEVAARRYRDRVAVLPALLERSSHLATLREARDTARRGRGVFVLLGGEAGGGKTALLRRFAAECDRVLWGACDPLFTPRPLGPFVDIAHETGGELRDLLDAGAKAQYCLERRTGVGGVEIVGDGDRVVAHRAEQRGAVGDRLVRRRDERPAQRRARAEGGPHGRATV